MLSAEREAITTAVEDEMAAKIAAAIDRIEAGGARIPDWKLKHDSWRLLEPGLDRSYRDGPQRRCAGRERTATPRASTSSANGPRTSGTSCGCWPAPGRGCWRRAPPQAHQLSELLGDHHDLAVLAEDLDARVGVVAERDAIGALIETRQEELLEQALGLGERLYAEKPKHYRRRLRAYWRAWRERRAS